MNTNDINSEIIILSPLEEPKGDSQEFHRSTYNSWGAYSKLKEFSVDSKRLALQIKTISEAFKQQLQDDEMKRLGIKKIEISLSVNAKGKLALLGSGLEGGANASIKLTIEAQE